MVRADTIVQEFLCLVACLPVLRCGSFVLVFGLIWFFVFCFVFVFVFVFVCLFVCVFADVIVQKLFV